MLNEPQLADYLAGVLPPQERARVEALLLADPQAQRTLADQENLDFALSVILGPDTAEKRVKQSIFDVLRSASDAQLRAAVMQEARTAVHPAGSRIFEGIREWHRVWRHRRWTIGAAFALLLVAAGLWVYLVPGYRSQVQIGQVILALGEPGVRGSRNSSEVAQPGTPIHFGDRIETGDADQAEIQFEDGTTLRLHFNTAVALPTPTNQTSSRRVARPPQIDLLHGQVWTKVQKSTNGSAVPYAIKTAPATAVARGTEFGVKVGKPAAAIGAPADGQAQTNFVTVLTVKEGVVDFLNAFGSVRATAMTESSASSGSAPTEPKRLQALRAMQLGNELDWVKVTSPLTPSEAGTRLAGGGGFAGVWLATSSGPGASSGAASNAPVTRITRVEAASPAAAAGLQPGDAILVVAGQFITNAHEVARAMMVRPDLEILVKIRRGLEVRDVTVKLAHRTNAVPGPRLTRLEMEAQRSLLARWSAEKESNEAARLEQARRHSRSPRTRPAACNNLGVLYQLEDAHGPAIRAYRQAVYLDPEVPLYRMNLALALRDVGSFERAHEELEEVLRLAPECIEAHLRLAELQSLLGNLQRALDRTEGALQMEPQHHGLWEIKSEILWKQQRYAEATAAARTAVATEPGCPVALHFLAVALKQEGRLADAEAAVRKSVQLEPLNPLFHLTLGGIQTQGGQLVAAERSLRQALVLKPDFQLAWLDLGRVLASRRQLADAKAAFVKAAELDPDDLTVIRELGRLALKEGRWIEAELQFREAIARAPQDWEGYFDLGQLLQRRGQIGEAEKMYLQATEVGARDSASLEKIGAVYRDQLGRLDKAEELYRKAVALSPQSGRAYSGLGQTLAMGGKLEEAEHVMRQAAELEPGSSEVQTTLGEVVRHRGKIEEAVQCNRKALELDPNNAAAYNNLGIIYAVRKEFGEAEKMFRELVDRSMTNTGSVPFNFSFNLGLVYLGQNRGAEAEKIFRESILQAPNEPFVLGALALALAKQQRNLDEALALSRRAVQMGPNDPNNLDTIGWVLLQRRELDEAEKMLSKALELAHEQPLIEQITEHLDELRKMKPNGPSKQGDQDQ